MTQQFRGLCFKWYIAFHCKDWYCLAPVLRYPLSSDANAFIFLSSFFNLGFFGTWVLWLLVFWDFEYYSFGYSVLGLFGCGNLRCNQRCYFGDKSKSVKTSSVKISYVKKSPSQNLLRENRLSENLQLWFIHKVN